MNTKYDSQKYARTASCGYTAYGSQARVPRSLPISATITLDPIGMTMIKVTAIRGGKARIVIGTRLIPMLNAQRTHMMYVPVIQLRTNKTAEKQMRTTALLTLFGEFQSASSHRRKNPVTTSMAKFKDNVSTIMLLSSLGLKPTEKVD